MKSYRPSISSKAYAKLVYLAATDEIKPGEFLDKLISEEWDRREEKKK